MKKAALCRQYNPINLGFLFVLSNTNQMAKSHDKKSAKVKAKINHFDFGIRKRTKTFC